MEAASSRFHAADTQVLGVSIDSVHCHANWARDLGGVSFPLLADFQPKGAAAKALGHYLPDAGITDRATVVVDKAGIVRYSESVTPAGHRNADDLVGICQEVNAAQEGAGGGCPARGAVPAGTTMFVKSKCGASRRALVALDNLRLRDQVTVRNVSDDAAAAADLLKAGGKDQAPCLVIDGGAVYEADEVTRALADRVAPLA